MPPLGIILYTGGWAWGKGVCVWWVGGGLVIRYRFWYFLLLNFSKSGCSHYCSYSTLLHGSNRPVTHRLVIFIIYSTTSDLRYIYIYIYIYIHIHICVEEDVTGTGGHNGDHPAIS